MFAINNPYDYKVYSMNIKKKKLSHYNLCPSIGLYLSDYFFLPIDIRFCCSFPLTTDGQGVLIYTQIDAL